MAMNLQLGPRWKCSLDSTRTGIPTQRRSRSNSPRGSSQLKAWGRRASESITLEAEQLMVRHPGRDNRLSMFNTELNKMSKWGAIALVAGTVLWMPDSHTLWAIAGCMGNSGLSIAIKPLINQSRPPTALHVKEDPGMPSSHAQGFSFMASYAALALLLAQGVKVWTVLSASSMFLTMAYLSWLRVADGLHTAPQVLVGGAAGSTTAALWLWIWKSGVEAALGVYPWARMLLYASFVVSCTLTYLVLIRSWQFGEF